MGITIHRVSPFRYHSITRRDDGVTVRVPGYDHPDWLPHDLGHCIVEHKLGLRGGFWARVIAGATFPNISVVSGRRPPHPEERSRALIRANGTHLTRAEVLVGAFLRITGEVLDANYTAARAHLARGWSQGEPITPDPATIEARETSIPTSKCLTP